MTKTPIYRVTIALGEREFTFLTLDDPMVWNSYGWYEDAEPAGYIDLAETPDD